MSVYLDRMSILHIWIVPTLGIEKIANTTHFESRSCSCFLFSTQSKTENLWCGGRCAFRVKSRCTQSIICLFRVQIECGHTVVVVCTKKKNNTKHRLLFDFFLFCFGSPRKVCIYHLLFGLTNSINFHLEKCKLAYIWFASHQTTKLNTI